MSWFRTQCLVSSWVATLKGPEAPCLAARRASWLLIRDAIDLYPSVVASLAPERRQAPAAAAALLLPNLFMVWKYLSSHGPAAAAALLVLPVRSVLGNVQ